MGAAASQAGAGPPDPANPWKTALTIWASIMIAPGAALHREREMMATRFIGDPKITAGLPPLRAVRRNLSPARAEVRQQMGQFMPQGAVDLVRAVVLQTGIERNKPVLPIGAPGAGFQPRAPLHANFIGDSTCSVGAQEISPFGLNIDIGL